MKDLDMSQAKQGDTVRVHYTGKLKDGQVFDSSRQGDPLELTIGRRQVIEGFEKAIEGMSPGQTLTIEILADDAYGHHDPQRVLEVPRDQLPAELAEQIAVGLELQVEQENGMAIPVIVTELSESTVTLDANHPLAGSDLTFELELVEIV